MTIKTNCTPGPKPQIPNPKPPRFFLMVTVIAASVVPIRIHAAPQVLLSVVPTITNVGVTATVTTDTDGDATATVRYRRAGSRGWRRGHPLVRTDDGRLATSLFSLLPARRYQIEVTVSDPDEAKTTTTRTSVVTARDTVREPTGRILHVATTGSDTNAGTSADAPLRTIQRAADLVEPGDRVRVSPGVYREAVTIRTSGTAAKPILFESTGWATKSIRHATVDGALPRLARLDDVDDWQPDPAGATGVHYATLDEFNATDTVLGVYRSADKVYAYSDSVNPERTTYDNFIQGIFCPSHLTVCHAANVRGGYWYDRPTKRLFVKLPDGSDPDRSTMQVVRRNRLGIAIEGASNIIVRGFEVRYFHVGLHIRGGADRVASNNILERNRTRFNQVGIGVGGYGSNGLNVHRNLVQDNRITDHRSVATWDWEDVKQNEVESTGVSVGAGSANVIRRNTIADVFNGIDMTIWWDAENAAYDANTDLIENEVRDVGDDALEVDGAGHNVRLIGNRVRKVRNADSGQAAVSLSPLTVGPTWVVRNTFLDSRQSNFKPFTSTTTKRGPVLIYHNTLVSSVRDLFALMRLVGVDAIGGVNLTFRNNALVARGREGSGFGDGYLIEDLFADHANPAIALTMDYDLFWTDRQCLNRTCPRFGWKRQPYRSLPSFRAASRLERHGRFADPRFTAPTRLNFTPAPTSPLIDRGVRLPGINDGFRGRSPDIGAVES